jgi:Zn ribbon nucleic-acid-binding protein
MHAHVVECLRCGRQRLVQARAHDAGECGCCGYVGWAAAEELTEHTRRALRERPLEQRRARITAA